MKNQDKFKHKIVFDCLLSKASSTEMDEIISKANLEDIKKIFPQNIDLAENRDLIGIVLNAAVAGRMNRNGDAITKEDALRIAKNFKNKYVNIEHNIKNIIGVIVDYAFSRFGNNELLSREEIEKEDFNEPFNISLAIIIWGSILSDESIEFIESSADPTSENYQKASASWEIFYNDYDIAVGSKNVKEANIVIEKEQIEKYQKYLKSNKGVGKIDDKFVYRVMKGPTLLPAGIGIVSTPAAEVLGLEIIDNQQITNNEENMKINESQVQELTKMMETVAIKILKDQQKSGGILAKAKMGNCPECGEESEMEEMEDEEEMSCAKCGKKTMKAKWLNKEKSEKIEKKEENISKSSETPVIVATNSNNLDQKIEKTMKIQLKTEKDLTGEVLKMEAAVVQDAVRELLENGIREANATYLEKNGALEKQLSEASEAAKQKESEIKALQENFAAIEKQLKELNDKALAAEMEAKFNQRMEGFAEEFELKDEVRQMIASEIKGLSDEDFSKYTAKMKVLLPKKVAKSEASAKIEVKEEVKEEVKKEELSTASEKVVSDAVKTAEVKTEIPNAANAEKETLLSRFAKAFTLEDGFTLDNKRIK